MRLVALQPLTGALGVTFGMSRVDARAKLGTPSDSFHKGVDVDAWLDGNVHVFYSAEGSIVEYIEVFRDGGLKVTCLGHEVFRLSASETLKRVEGTSGYRPTEREAKTSYVFAELELAFWRPFASWWGEGRRFKTVGIGRPGYFSAE